MKWNIVMDSSCDTYEYEHQSDITFTGVPFIINIGDREYVDDGTIDLPYMIDDMIHEKTASHTSCPSPHTYSEAFSQEGNVFGVTISKELSGSYNSATAAKYMTQEEYPDKKIHIINSIGTGPSLIIIVRKLVEMIDAGMDYDTIQAKIDEIASNVKIVFALNSFDNLVKNGRMSKLAGFVANTLGFWGVGIGSPEGKIVIKTKTRGTKKAMKVIVDDILSRGNNVKSVVISHCMNPQAAEDLKNMIKEQLSQVTVDIFPTRGLDSFYAEKNGLIVSYY